MPIRDVVIVTIVLALALLALRRPWVGVMNWTWLSIMNPHRYAWGFSYDAPLASIAAGSTLLSLLFTKERASPFKGVPVVWLSVFTIWMTLSWVFGLDTKGDYAQWDKVIKIYLMTFVALSLLNTKYHIMAFTWVTIGSLAFLAAKGGVFTVLTGGSYRVWGPAGSFIADNNHFALATIITIPMLRFLQLQLEEGWKRHVMTVIMLLCVAAAVGSHSRGALLALMAMGGVFWLRSPRRGMVGMVMLFSIPFILLMMPEEWWARMQTIGDYQEDTSAMGRIHAWLVAIEVAKDYLFGAGMSYQHVVLFQMYSDFSYGVIAAHSIYFQILGNHGFIGLFIYMMIWVTTYRYATWLRRNAIQNPETQWAAELGAMVQVSIVGFLVGGAFLSMPYFDLPYNLMVVVVLARCWVERQMWETEPRLSFLEHIGIRTPRKPSLSSVGSGSR